METATVEDVKRAIRDGANVNARDKGGVTALGLAERYSSNADIIRYIRNPAIVRIKYSLLNYLMYAAIVLLGVGLVLKVKRKNKRGKKEERPREGAEEI